MGSGTLTIYSASAGSGKTYKLTGIYLANLFKSRYYYRKILAVTFTHKATAEMKSRILENLHKLASGEKSEYLADLLSETKKSEQWIREESSEILNAILHDYSRFSVSTIDSFFQKILRAFTREAGLNSGYDIELDHSSILSAAVDALIKSAPDDDSLKNWLISYAMSNIDNEKSWNLKEGIIKLGEELFKERFKLLSANEQVKLGDKNFLIDYIRKLKSLTSSVENKLTGYGKKCEEIVTLYDVSDDQFYRKSQGVPRYIKILCSGTPTAPNSYTREILNDPPKWSTGAMAPNLKAAIENGLGSLLKEAILFYDENNLKYNTASVILSNIYTLGILSDVLHNVHLITNSENKFLLSDAGEVLNLITGGDQTPFIYEKVGNRYENYMIDEFQDTSFIQWNNFKPLIDNSMAEGYDNLVVGDVKQSIYRWRNSDWKILGLVLNQMIDNNRIIGKPLNTNWRSRSNIIKFCNTLFSVIPSKTDSLLSDNGLQMNFSGLYSEAEQKDPGIKEGGYVRIEFVSGEEEDKWEERVLKSLPGVIESVQDKGYNASDIGILVRDGKEGASVLKSLIEYSNNCSQELKEKYSYNVVSNDSLLLSNSPVINFIIAVLKVVVNPDDMISRALLLRFYLLSTGDKKSDEAPLFSSELIAGSQKYLPEGYEIFLDRIKNVPLFEAIESIIKFFGLGEHSWNVAYLNTFQDYVVNYTSSKNSDLQSFIDWWQETGNRKSVVLPGNQEAMRILTVHKSKGLEFSVVIIPFLGWQLDHIPSKYPFLWVKPTESPFDELGIVPVKYGKDLQNTIFSDDYFDEKNSIYLDNINLAYVALTRAKDALFIFSPESPRSKNSIASLLKDSITDSSVEVKNTGCNLPSYFNESTRIFEFGEIPANRKEININRNILSLKYIVNNNVESLRLKLHGENYFASEAAEVRKKINYGKLMHEVFESIHTVTDVKQAIRKLFLEGKLPEEEVLPMETRILSLLNSPEVSKWFDPGNKVLNEAGILLPSGATRRPDRVILKDGRAIVIDFKFGKENVNYIDQVKQYRHLLIEMGYNNTEGYIWYVDNNKIVNA